MFGLDYPLGTTDFLGAFPDEEEFLPVVDELGHVQGRGGRHFCHESRNLHPVVHLHIFDRYSRLYLQKRSQYKKYYPLMWDTAVGGHISYGESPIEALHREAFEELGFRDFNPIGLMNYVYEDDSERELVYAYAAIGSFKLNPSNDEVVDGRYWTLEEIEENLGKGIFTPEFEQEYPRVKDKLLALL